MSDATDAANEWLRAAKRRLDPDVRAAEHAARTRRAFGLDNPDETEAEAETNTLAGGAGVAAPDRIVDPGTRVNQRNR